jgi:hypothetical protein
MPPGDRTDGGVGWLAGARAPKPFTFTGPPQGMTYTAKNVALNSVLFLSLHEIFIV